MPWCGLRSLGAGCCHVEGPGIDVAKHRNRTGIDHRLCGRVEGERGRDHLVSGLDAEGAQRDGQRVCAIGHADAVSGPEEIRELGLEGLDLGAEDVAPGGGHFGEPLREPLVVARERRCEKRDRHGPLP